ncbi:TonB-dependent receptor [Pseudobacter ginsenosidimutans]|uniref:TonB-linked SusC/RagA family outer membrane protein n=1 Tax=Pseudobacter ginsenosidimutans TaxID=661488 RepID=A0A4Q7N533_9BACT|nr:TonB-dependent receptor [Pseudobacter ginsenosidimutans]QEC44665.1 TonB-dependent receptor [Pseudobacter ginsenosidimutans]RZS76145.1 TonB-linked SusC/RagA family outer membrane protein [Pseudobacter ginsenosidimutans]
MLLKIPVFHYSARGSGITKMLRIMKLTAFLILFFCLHGYAESYGQKVTLDARNDALEKVLSTIQQQTGTQFFFNERLLKKARPVTVSLKDASLIETLNKCFEGQPFSYTIVQNTVIITHKPDAPPRLIVMPEEPAPEPITGIVTGPNGKPMPGVSVMVKGEKNGTLTDQQGRYSLQTGDHAKVLVFSHVGMITKEVLIGSRKAISIALEEGNTSENEIVVIGYGTSKAKDLTGSVARVTDKDLEGAPPHADMAAMLQGKAAGVNVMVANGAPGAPVAIQIRGTSSLNGNNQPLWVIDGIPQYNVNGSDIATILYDFNIRDVESIDILKDASATAIYGSRAASGVVLVTTKKGSKTKRPVIEFSTDIGIQKQSDQFRMLNTDEFKSVIKNATSNYFSTLGTGVTTGGISLVLDYDKIVPGAEVDYASTPFKSTAFFDGSTNWWNELSQDAIESKYDVSIRGGNQASNYYIAVGVVDQQGIIKGSNRKGFTGRFNFDTQIGEKINTGIRVSGAYSKLNNKDDMIDKIWNFRPDFPMFDESGKIFDPGYNEENPLTSLKNKNLTDRKSVNAMGYVEFKPIRSLTLRSSYSVNYNNSIADRFSREGTVYTSHKGQATIRNSETSTTVFENTATYNGMFNKIHSLSAVGGFILENAMYKDFYAGVQNFPDQDIMINLTSGTTPMKPTSTYTSSALASAIARLNYKFDNKYLATFTFRSDGSSRFGPDKRWGFFPSGALAWVASEESFVKQLLPAFSYLKLRSSFGKSGSQVLGNDDWRTLYSAAQYYEQPGMTPSQLGNNDLQWETTISLDGGIDFALNNDRIRGTLGAYVKETKDIIYTRSIPSSSAFTSVKQNVASIRNRGVEFDIAYDLVKTKNTTFTVGFNIAHNLAKALKINGVDSVIEIYSGSALAMRIKEGEPISQWIGYQWSGRYYQSMEEYNLLSGINPTTGAKIWYQNGLNSIRPGDLRFDDINGDGIVDSKDRVPLGSAQPKFFGGFNTNLRYKNFSFTTQFSFAYGAKRYWYTNAANWYGVGLFLKNYPSYVLDSWTPENRDAAWPRMSYGQGSSNTFSDFWLSRADYLRLNLVRVNYRIPQRVVKLKVISAIDLSIAASNLLTLTNYNGIDPQGNFRLTNGGGGISGIGSDYGIYPSVKTFNFAARISFN